MHLLFTEEELKYIDTQEFGWPAKAQCPKEILKSIENKKKLLEFQHVRKPEKAN